MAKVQHVKVREIRIPEVYVRIKGTDDEHLAYLRQVIKDTLEPGEKLTAENWPLDPIIIWETEPKRGRKFEIIEGVHRYLIADAFKMETVPAEIRKYDSLADARLAQLTENMRKKLGVDLESRDAWVRMLVSPAPAGQGMKQETVAKAVGLSQGSVSRIITDAQRGEGRKKKAKRGKKRKRAKKATTVNGYNVTEWYGALGALVEEYDEHGAAIIAGKSSADPEMIVEAFNALGEIVNAPAGA